MMINTMKQTKATPSLFAFFMAILLSNQAKIR